MVAACGLLPQEPSPLVAGSQWRIAGIDGVRTPGDELLLTFIGDSVTLSSQCGAGVSEVVAATDGPELDFGAFEGPAEGAPCPPEIMALHERVARALEGVERWERAGSVTELLGESVIRLEPQRTDT